MAVLVLPLYNPMRVLEEIGMVDQLSDGRLVIGYGSGYQAFEFERFGSNLADNWAITHEIMDILEMGLAEGRVAYDGKHYQIPETPIGIPILQKPRPPGVYGRQRTGLSRARGQSRLCAHRHRRRQRHGCLVGGKEHIAKNFDKAGHKGPLCPSPSTARSMSPTARTDARDAAERVLYTARLVMAFRGGYEKAQRDRSHPAAL